MTKQPSYRFAGYTEPWEEKKLGEVLVSLNDIVSGSSGFPIATSSRKGLFLQNEYFSGDRAGIDRTLDFHRLPVGYITYRHMSDDSIFRFNKNNFDTDVLVSKEYPVFTVNDKANIDFILFHLNSSPEFLKFSILQKLGGTRVRLYFKNLSNYQCSLPPLPEQTAIGSFFKDIDRFTSLQQRKLEVLKEQKETYLKLLFPAKGQTKPALRFEGFEDEWEQQKASEIFYSVSDKNHVDLPVLSASQEHGMVQRDEIGIDIKYDKASVKTYKRVKPGQFVIHLRSFQGGFAHSDIEGITSPAYTVLDFSKSNKHFDLFWKEVFTSQNFIKRLETVTYGIRDGRSISFSDFSSLKLQFPSLPEQEAIGSFFQELDKSIAKQEEKVNQLKERKQTLLRKMFI